MKTKNLIIGILIIGLFTPLMSVEGSVQSSAYYHLTLEKPLLGKGNSTWFIFDIEIASIDESFWVEGEVLWKFSYEGSSHSNADSSSATMNAIGQTWESANIPFYVPEYIPNGVYDLEIAIRRRTSSGAILYSDWWFPAFTVTVTDADNIIITTIVETEIIYETELIVITDIVYETSVLTSWITKTTEIPKTADFISIVLVTLAIGSIYVVRRRKGE